MESVVETRWLVLCGDGRHTTLGRHRDPDAAEIDCSESQLKAQGLSGWLVLMKGGYYDTKRRPELLMIRPLGHPEETWSSAAAAFEANRQKALRPS